MLALIGVLTIVIMLVLIMTKKLQTLLALIIVPIIGCLVAGFTGNIVLEEGVFTVKTMGEFITADLHWYSHFSLSRSFGWFRRSNIPDCYSSHAAAL